MKKIYLILFVIVALIIAIAVFFGSKLTKTVDWTESFNEKSTKPYGLSIFYKELPNLFKNNTVKTVYHQPDSYLRAQTDSLGNSTAKGSYIIIGNSDYLEYDAVDALLDFVSNGNTLFISDYWFPESITDTLGISVDYAENPKDSISYLLFKSLKLKGTNIDKNEGDNYFSSINAATQTVLGYGETDSVRTNFIKAPFGNGTILLHTEPKIFTNYNILKNDRYQYVEGVVSYLPEADVYFDSYSKIQSSYYGEAEKKSNLSWFLQQPPFKWAWYTALIFTLLFIIFNAKRRQRIIKIIKPLENTTVAFVKTVSNLYFETQDHKNLIDKKITYFLEKTRTDYNIETTELNDGFIEKLITKSNKKPDDIKNLVRYMAWLRAQSNITEDHLIKLNKQIEAFYYGRAY
ncbi:MAG: DUF4350 domain-containing protein [Flavobacteriaceae bacterium]